MFDISPLSPSEHENALSVELVNSPFGKRLMDSSTTELRTLHEVIDCTSDCK